MRYTGPRGKKARRLAKSFTDKEARILERRQSLPGQHGQSRGKQSEFALQMREKQRAKFAYGVTEKQFYRTYLTAQRMAGQAGENLLKLLESRLDNVVYRLGFAKTRPEARQLVSHGFVEVNGRKNNIASALVATGDVVSIRQNKREKSNIAKLKDILSTVKTMDWLEVDGKNLKGKVLSIPSVDQAESIDTRLVVEHYQRI